MYDKCSEHEFSFSSPDIYFLFSFNCIINLHIGVYIVCGFFYSKNGYFFSLFLNHLYSLH